MRTVAERLAMHLIKLLYGLCTALLIGMAYLMVRVLCQDIDKTARVLGVMLALYVVGHFVFQIVVVPKE